MKLTRAQAKALGFQADRDAPASPKKKGKKPDPDALPATEGRSAAGQLFEEACKGHGLPIPDHEYKFHKTRMWRFDYLFEGWLAIELEGDPWASVNGNKSRHFHGQGILDDMEKYNEAVIAGYAILRFTHKQVKDGSAFAVIKRALAGGVEEQP